MVNGLGTPEPEWLKVGEVAVHYRVSKMTVYRWAWDLPEDDDRVIRVGPSRGSIRIHRSVIDDPKKFHSTVPTA
jgi:hypothetical protein